IDLAAATDVSDVTGATNLAPLAVPKTLFLDVVEALTAAGISDIHIPAKLEGIAFGQDVILNGVTMHTLYITNDNDFLAAVPDKNNVIVDNPNQYFVFAFSDADLPGFVPQKFTGGRFHDEGPWFSGPLRRRVRSGCHHSLSVFPRAETFESSVRMVFIVV